MIPARETILELIKEHNIKTYIEVGCWKGELLRQVRDLGVEVIGIDPLRQEFNEFEGYTCRMGNKEAIPQDNLDKIADDLSNEFGDKFLRMTSIEASKLPIEAEMVFIDAIHDYDHIKEDITAWFPKATKILCGDDYKKRFEGLKQGVDEMIPDRIINGIVWIKYK